MAGVDYNSRLEEEALCSGHCSHPTTSYGFWLSVVEHFCSTIVVVFNHRRSFLNIYLVVQEELSYYVKVFNRNSTTGLRWLIPLL